MQIPISRLTRRANQRHIVIIADIVKLAPVNRPRAFSFAADAIRREVSNYPTCCIAFFCNLLTVQKAFDTSGKSPAHYHHRENRAEPGRRNPPRAFCLKFSNRTAAARHDASSPNARRLGRHGACRRPNP
jgi:hypothetical protein